MPCAESRPGAWGTVQASIAPVPEAILWPLFRRLCHILLVRRMKRNIRHVESRSKYRRCAWRSCLAPGARYQLLGQVPGTSYQVLGIKNRVLVTDYLGRGTGSSTRHQVPGIWYAVPGTTWTPGTRLE